MKNADGYYVKADRQVVYGKTKKEKAQNIEIYINEHILNNGEIEIVTDVGERITITSTTAWKIADIKKNVKGETFEMSDEEFDVKVHAGAHIDELLKISMNTGDYDVDRKDHYYADYWDYRYVFLKIMIEDIIN